MAAFITGLIIGGTVGFLICAVCAASGSRNTDKDSAKRENGAENGKN